MHTRYKHFFLLPSTVKTPAVKPYVTYKLYGLIAATLVQKNCA